MLSRRVENPLSTQKLAQELSSFLKKGDILGLRGNLGSGKTTFVQGLARGLKILNGYAVSSPTFAFIHEYACSEISLFHMDFYRLSQDLEAETLGLDLYLQGQGICAIEWFEKAQALLPKDFLELEFQGVSENTRDIHMIAHGPRSQKILSNFF
ncbi:MAG: tRNA (adenosine(37)-N6)-threonylcarbamoyltransferase complex ATPase subunit type 1 TsaE [Deltaproteobacteria bacterium]|nr:tRNA (adenosine(37)-N6)-threonylcarbamoyltransferase complex ATPase subunit type 1 TsaE [Deltaproteobacteria bacterium]